MNGLSSRHAMLLGIVILVGSATGAQAENCVQPLSQFGTQARKQINGTWEPVLIGLWLDANAPGNLGGIDWGDATKYNLFDPDDYAGCITGKTNCDSEHYEYMTVSINTAWSVTISVNFTPVTFTVADTEAYWDHKYTGYSKVGSVNYSQNCHGYAFGVGDWPADIYGCGVLVDTPCYQPQYIYNADIATLTDNTHSMKVTGAICSQEYAFTEIFATTTEKYRESAIYEQSQFCSSGVNPLRAHPFSSIAVYTKAP